MMQAFLDLFSSRKFLVTLMSLLGLLFPAVFKVIPADLAAELGSAVVGAMLLAHAHQASGEAQADATVQAARLHADAMTSTAPPARPAASSPQ